MTPAQPASPDASDARPDLGRAFRRAPGSARAWLGPALVGVGVALLVSLGVWQLERLQWKTRLIARVAALQAAPPEPLNVVLNRLGDGVSVDFTRVIARCTFGPRTAHLYGLRDSGPGWRQIAACPMTQGRYGSVLVDLGYTRGTDLAAPAAETVSLPADAPITGVLRAPEPQPWFAGLITPRRAPGSTRFTSRDIPGMAQVLSAPQPAPVMLTLESPAAGPGLTPAPLPTDIPNRHLEYALTWFGLAAALVGVWLAAHLAARRRDRVPSL